MAADDRTDWSHKTVPQRKACLNSINQQSSWSAGRGLGGTSNLNFMTHLRGHPMDYDNWKEITGDDSWSYAGVLPYFKRTETFSGTSNDPEARGHDGELRIRKPSYVGLSEDWIRAGQEIGYPFVDLNGRHEEGFGILQYPIYKGIRQSTYAAFLLPYHKSPRLTIRRYALVRKVLFRDMNNMAYGVEYVRHGSIETAIATREVILTAGTLGSSKLLMLSGIGPRGHLEELGIPVRSNLPVGRSLQDHLAVPLGPFFIKEPKSFLFDRDVRPENIIRWLFLGTGPITTTGYQGAASIASSVAKSRGEGNWPDLHLILHGQAIHQGYVDAFAYAYSLQEDELMQYYTNAVGRDSFHINVVGARPTSKGQVLLSGASINDPLVINPRYLEDPGDWDFKILLEGVKAALTIAHNTSVFQRLGTEFTPAKLPGCQDHQQWSDAYWECYIRRYTLTMHNPVGTAPLMEVVDASLRVMGTRGLRVMDASVQPTLVTTGTSASTLMIAEKGVDMILKDHGIPHRDTDMFDLLFGRHGFFKKNPVLRILQRELDTINPLRALFKPFASVKDVDSDVKERFTRNGRIDNPFLQVISNVFGNANQNQDISASATTHVNVNFDGTALGQGANLDPTLLQKKSGENNVTKSNVISKSQWVLQSSIFSTTPSPPRVTSPELVSSIASASSSSTTSVLAANEASDNNLKITEILPKPTKKGKGGRRYALLQAILKENHPTILQEKYKIKLTTPTTTSSTTTTTTTTTSTTQPTTSSNIPSTSTPLPTTTTIKSVVDVLNFGVNLNSTENEIAIDEPPSKGESFDSGNTTSNTSDTEYIAKSVGVTQSSVLSILQQNNNDNFNSILQQGDPDNVQNTTPNPLNDLLKSLHAFEHLMNSLSSSAGNNDTQPQTSTASNPFSNTDIQNPFTGIFNNFLSVINNTAESINSGLQGNPVTNRSNSNPFQFLFGNSQSTNTANNISSSSSSNTTNNNESMFSSWFKPLSNNQLSSTSSWFKPITNNLTPLPSPPLPKPAWFSPPSNKNYVSPLSPSWFNVTNNQQNQLAPAWFTPLSFPSTNSTSIPTTTTPAPNLNLFELFLGGLKKEERKTMFNTLDSMFPNQNILNFTGPSTNNNNNTSRNNATGAELLAKSITINPASVQKLMDMAIDVKNKFNGQENKSGNVLQTLLSLSNLMSPQTTTTTQRPPNIFDQILSAFNPSATATTKPPSFFDLFLKG
ncbi:unnamed protein product [Orchesella dallaii]|uniref:Glucose-methanol-choline oxidoreductase N-terminal domain-containing protein n=1 Tax=Orchesella dallaii TaxID=48710 RepID=A0ABP1RNE7_9HEXA